MPTLSSQRPDGPMPHSGRYAALDSAYMAERGENSDEYELETLTVQPATSGPAHAPVMPSRYHRMLDSFLQGKGGSEDSDSDSETTLDGGAYDGDAAAAPSKHRGYSFELLFSKQRPRNGHKVLGDDIDDKDDLEAQPQPAWMRSGYISENNVLRRHLALPTIIIILLVVLAAFFAGHSTLQSTSPTAKYQGAKKRLTLEESLYATYWAETKSIRWLGEAGDGVYSYKSSDNSIMLQDLNSNTTRSLIQGRDILKDDGSRLEYASYQVSSDLRYILFTSDIQHAWRHSTRANYWIHDLEHSTTVSLVPKEDHPTVEVAKWAPQGHNIAYVRHNDLYITILSSINESNNTSIRITSDGNETTFNGIPDWVYEEEVFSSDSAMWWSPDGKKLAFLSFDESEVQVYSYPIYNPDSQPGASAYPSSLEMRYPKPGTPNPKVTIRMFDLSAYQSGFPIESATYTLQVQEPLDRHDQVVTEVAWTGYNDLIVKETNRAATRERTVHFNLSNIATEGLQLGAVVRDIDYAVMDGGWAPAGQRITSLVQRQSSSSSTGKLGIPDDLPEGYLDVIPDAQGFMHLALFSPSDAKEPVFLTSGEWEMDQTVKAVDTIRRQAYFIAARPSTERHLYSVSIPTKQELQAYRAGKGKLDPPKNMTDSSSPGFYDVSFSPEAGYYLLGQRSGIPWQKILKVEDPGFELVIADNADLKAKLAQYNIPKTSFMTADINNISFNVAATLPPSYDTTGRHKYPMLLRPYGGPNSQTVQNKFRIDWTHYLASQGYIVLEVDGRGTGFKGRSFRNPIRNNLGELEARDQIAVAEWYKDTHPFVDSERIGIQGWSYGGYLAAKVVETNSTTISLGMSVAPVTDWRYYDSIYTERYMGTLEDNKEGYDKSSVHDMNGFHHADYLLLHGSGDDNVHYLNSAALLDRLTVAKVDKFKFRMFTDSAHSMGVRGAYGEVFAEMTRFLDEKFGEKESSL